MVKQKTKCTHCNSTSIVKRGFAKNKLQTLQKYQCKDCKAIFTTEQVKGKTYPLKIILNAISTYNLGYSLEKAAEKINKKYSLTISAKTINNWLNEYKSICTYNRLRKSAINLYKPNNIIHNQTLSHIQPYTFKYHKAKLYLLFHNKLYNNQFHNISLFYEPLKNYLEKISTNKFPHHIFTYAKDSASGPDADIANNILINDINKNKNNKIINKNYNETIKNSLNIGAGQNVKDSASGPDAVVAKNNNSINEYKDNENQGFSRLVKLTNENKNKIGNIGAGQNDQRASQIRFNHLKITTLSKNNLACKLASLALNLAATNKERHQKLQDFFLLNDSTTIATELPIYLTNWDAGYYRNQRGFNFPLDNYKTPITGHIDLLQIRNGLLHILDYKPEAEKINAIDQLTIYAMALSRKLNLELYYFKAAWFDENNYYEFFPLHAVYEKQNITKKEKQLMSVKITKSKR